MKTYKEYVEKGFVGAPELYLKNGDEIDIALAAELISGTDMDVADLEAWDGGILQSTHPADIIAGQGTFDTIHRISWMKPFIYRGQCFAGEMINKNPQLSRYVYICSAYNAETEEERTANAALAEKYCRKRNDSKCNKTGSIQGSDHSKERNLRYGRETKITMGTFTQFICIADGYCVLSEWSGKTGRGNIGKLAESVCLHLVASIAELVE